MSNPRSRRAVRNRRLPEPWQRLEHSWRFRFVEVNGQDLAVLDERQWVPIGPSIARATMTRREGHLLVSGRVRDLQIDRTGSRAYAGTAKGGVWYTSDSGRTWRPVGGWTRRIGRRGGANSVLSVGALLVHFGDNSSEDFVMVGTGELNPDGYSSDEAIKIGGVGVLAALGPANNALDEDPWEAADGLSQMEGVGILRLARRPGVTPGGDGDEVVAVTSRGLFRGVRSSGRFSWTRIASTFRDEFDAPYPFQDADGDPQQPMGADALWLPVQGNSQGRLFATLTARHEHRPFFGPPTPAYSDDGGRTFRQINGAVNGILAERMQRPRGRASLSAAGEGADVRVYVMGGWLDEDSDAQVEICAVDHPLAAHDAADPPTLRRLDVPRRTRRFWESGDKSRFWGTQGGYSQAITAAQFGTGAPARDRLFLGGSGFWGRGHWMASLWCFEVDGDDLVPIPGISSTGGTNRSFRPGHIGSGLHVDIHAIRVASGDTRKVWVGNDGGVTVSTESGRDNTFITRSDGIAAMESQYGASHPGSSSFTIFGCHDNGIMARDGDVVWREALSGDGGGVAFDPQRPHHLLGQLQKGIWRGRPNGWFATPGVWTTDDRPDEDNAQFYSNASTSRLDRNANVTRIAIGTDRVWVNDQRGRARANRWWVLPGHNFPAVQGVLQPQGPVRRARRSGGNLPARGRREVTFGILQFNETAGSRAERPGISAVRWVRNAQGQARSLLVLLDDIVCRYDQVGDPADHRWRPNLVTWLLQDGGFTGDIGTYLVTEIAPVQGTNMFYLATTGEEFDPGGPHGNAVDTLYFHDGTQLHATGLKDEITQRDPAFSVAVDDETDDVYVGTALGVWRGVRDSSDNSFDWDLIGRRLPPAVVQDLHVHKPSPDAPKTLVAALASRGLWQLNLDREDHAETWIRAHRYDDRRVFPTPQANPRRSTAAGPLAVDRSPDIVIRPRWPRTDPPPAYPGRPLTRNRHTPYQIWTFQTAFRRFSPAIEVDGRWTRPFELAVQRFRAERSDVTTTGTPTIDRRLWNLVVVDDPTAAYEPAWRPRLTGVPMAANEVDLRSVVPQRRRNGRWQVPGEQCTVEVLIHHRDTNIADAGDAFAMLLWQWGNTGSVTCDGIADFARGVDRTTGVPGPSPSGWTAPTVSNPNGRFRGWHVAMTGPSVLHRLPVQLDARMPRAVPVDIDLSRNFGDADPTDVVGPVVLLALVGSTSDPFSQPPPATGVPVDFVRSWRHAALHTVVCSGPR